MGPAEIVALLIAGLVIGALARLAVPGPDPMPIWLTIVFGVAGSLLGGGIGFSVGGNVGGFVGAVLAATLLIVGYRLLIQKRPITGPGAMRRP